MSENQTNARGTWSSQLAFVLAAAGSAVGLGNIWKFPYIVHHNGGGAFVLVYLVCILLVGLPIMWAEVYIGKKTGRDPVGAFKALSNNSPLWKAVGFLGVASGFVILSYYAVVAGWVLHYIVTSITGELHGISKEAVGSHFGTFIADPWSQLGYQAVIMVLTAGIVLGGVKGGIERANKVLMPALFAIILCLMVYVMATMAGGKAVSFLFNPSNFGELGWAGVLEALGHSFFTLSLGMGAMITYGSYLSKEESAVTGGFWIVVMDTAISLMACLLIYSILFSFDEEVGKGPGLLFITMPRLFEQMTGHHLFSTLFFVLVLFAALTSAVSLLEVVVAFFIDEEHTRRRKATVIAAVMIFLLGVPSALANGVMADFKIFGMDFFTFADYLASNWMLTVGGLFIALFAGYAVNEPEMREEMAGRWPWAYPLWRFVLRYITPMLVLFVIAKATGLLDLLGGK